MQFWSWSWDIAFSFSEAARRDPQAALHDFAAHWNAGGSPRGTMKLTDLSDGFQLTLVGPFSVNLRGIMDDRGAYFTSRSKPFAGMRERQVVDNGILSHDVMLDLLAADGDQGTRGVRDVKLLAFADLHRFVPIFLAQVFDELPAEVVEIFGIDELTHAGFAYLDSPPAERSTVGDVDGGDSRRIRDCGGAYRLAIGSGSMRESLDVLRSESERRQPIMESAVSGADWQFDVSVGTGAGIMNLILDKASVVAAEIRDEFMEDADSFRRDTGVAPMEVLANLTGRAVLAGVNGFAGDPLLAVQVVDAHLWRRQFRSLVEAFDLNVERFFYKGHELYAARRIRGDFHFSLVGDVVMFSRTQQVLTAAIDTHVGPARGAAFSVRNKREVARSLPDGLAFRVSRRALETLLDGAPGTDERARVFDGVEEFVLRLYPGRDHLMVELGFGGARGPSPTTIVTAVAIPSMAEARENARRTVSMANVKRLITALMIHAHNNGNKLPHSLEALGELVDRKALANPYRRESNEGVDVRPFYVYRPPASWPVKGSPSQVVIVAEPALRNGGAVFGFADGHVEYVSGERAVTMLRSFLDG